MTEGGDGRETGDQQWLASLEPDHVRRDRRFAALQRAIWRAYCELINQQRRDQ